MSKQSSANGAAKGQFRRVRNFAAVDRKVDELLYLGMKKSDGSRSHRRATTEGCRDSSIFPFDACLQVSAGGHTGMSGRSAMLRDILQFQPFQELVGKARHKQPDVVSGSEDCVADRDGHLGIICVKRGVRQVSDPRTAGNYQDLFAGSDKFYGIAESISDGEAENATPEFLAHICHIQSLPIRFTTHRILRPAQSAILGREKLKDVAQQYNTGEL